GCLVGRRDQRVAAARQGRVERGHFRELRDAFRGATRFQERGGAEETRQDRERRSLTGLVEERDRSLVLSEIVGRLGLSERPAREEWRDPGERKEIRRRRRDARKGRVGVHAHRLRNRRLWWGFRSPGRREQEDRQRWESVPHVTHSRRVALPVKEW